jgi:hypothetical protein
MVAVDQPFDPVDAAVPLLPGTHVEVAIQGRSLPQAFRIPRSALHDGARVWVVEADVLSEREVSLGAGDAETILISEGLTAGEQLVTSPLSLPVNGQPVEIMDSPAADEE